MKEHEIERCLSTKTFGRRIYAFESLGSTNDFARTLIQDRPREGTIVISEEQTSGKGRQGRSWVSEKGKDLTFSVLVEPGIDAARYGLFSFAAALAVAEAVREVAHVDAECKWPNDVLLSGKKICGILSERVSAGGTTPYIIIGIGVNVNQTGFPGVLAQSATSLVLETGREIDRLRLLSAILLSLESFCGVVRSDRYTEVLEAWKRRSTAFGREITLDQDGRRITGIARTLAPDGALIIRTGDQDRSFHAGDVTIVR